MRTVKKSYYKLWPLILLFIVEASALAFSSRYYAPGVQPFATPFSTLVALLILLTGLLPALLQPGEATVIAGCLATVMAGILITPFSSSELPQRLLDNPLMSVMSWRLILRLVNGVFLGPLALHFAIVFPLRLKVSSRVLVSIYLASSLLLAFLLVGPNKVLRAIAMVILIAWTLGLLAIAAYLLLRNSRNALPENLRAAQQARLLFFCLVLAELPALLRPLGVFLRIEIIPYDVFLALQILIPLGIAYAVLRHDLFGIDSALRRALAYTVLSILLLLVYFGLTVGLAALFTRTWPDYRGLAAFISLFIAALAFEPSRRRVQYLIDRLLYPDRLDFQYQVAQARAILEQVISREEVIRLLTVDLPPRLGVSWASLSLTPAPDLPGRVDPKPAWNEQLMVGGKSLGRYWLGSRRAGPSFDLDEQALLRSLVGQAALALAYADTIEDLNQLNSDLEDRVDQRTAQVLASQRALAAFEERQRLARDLHDSVTQSLFSINLSARALRRMVHPNPETVITGLNELEQTSQQALAEMRTLLAQLRSPSQIVEPVSSPASTTSMGSEDLVAMLTGYCETLRRSGFSDQDVGHPKYSQSDLPEPLRMAESKNDEAFPLLDVHLDLPLTMMVPTFVAHQVMQIVREGLHNVIKHSGVPRAICRAVIKEHELKLAVIDEGGGFDPKNPPETGFGIRGMQERVQSLGGVLEIQSTPASGATLILTIPLHDTMPLQKPFTNS